MVDKPCGTDTDVLAIFRQADEVIICQLIFRQGTLTASKNYNFSQIAQDDRELLESFLLQHYEVISALPDEIVNILKARYPDELRPVDVRQQLEKLGHDMDAYTNPLATIHMVLKRLVEANRIRERQHAQGFRVYRFLPRTLPRLDGGLDPEKMPERIRQFIHGTGKMPPRTRPLRKTIGQRIADHGKDK